MAERNIVRDETKPHYYETGIYCAGSIKNNGTTRDYENWEFVTNNSYRYESYSWVNANATIGVSGTIPAGTHGFSGSETVTLQSKTPSTSIVSFTTATMQYGEKAEPSISASYKGGYLNPTTSQTITFTSDVIATIHEQYTISSGVLYYKTSDAVDYQSISFTGRSVTIPANTLVTGQTYNVYADITVDDGTVVTVSIANISTVDAIPTVTPISPINTVLYGAVTFSWSYSVSTGANQLAFDIQTSTDGGTSYTMLADHVEQTTTSYSVDYPTSGTIYWQVRGYNQDNVASAWSTAVSFVNNIPPNPPVITSVTATGRPVVSWSANDQIAYQVQVLNGDTVIEDSGAVYSSGKQYQTGEFLPEGTYTIRVRIYNVYGKASDWATALFTETSTITPPAFTLSGGDDGIRVAITPDPAVAVYYIKRNGVTIGQTDTGAYTDRFANGATTYTVIGVTEDGMSAQSTQSITFTVKSNMMITTDGTVFLVNHRMGSPVGVSKQVSATYDQANYIGASLPEHHFAKLKEGRFTIAFKDYVNVENLLGQTVFYADMYGNGDWCAVVSTGRVESRYGNETTAELQLTTYDEGIAYA